MLATKEETHSPAFLFVYGTLKRAETGEVHPLLKKKAEFYCRAKVQGKLYQRDGYPGLVAAGGSEAVDGELYRLRDAESLLKSLDHYEGCASGPSAQAEFFRASREVKTGRGEKLTAWMYLLTDKPDERFFISEGVYRR